MTRLLCTALLTALPTALFAGAEPVTPAVPTGVPPLGPDGTYRVTDEDGTTRFVDVPPGFTMRLVPGEGYWVFAIDD